MGNILYTRFIQKNKSEKIQEKKSELFQVQKLVTVDVKKPQKSVLIRNGEILQTIISYFEVDVASIIIQY